MGPAFPNHMMIAKVGRGPKGKFGKSPEEGRIGAGQMTKVTDVHHTLASAIPTPFSYLSNEWQYCISHSTCMSHFYLGNSLNLSKPQFSDE